MTRKIKITICDIDTNATIEGETDMDSVNDLYSKHGINGISQLAIAINGELNLACGNHKNLQIPNDLAVLPEGKKW